MEVGTAMRPGSYRVLRFGPFQADVQAGELRKDGEKVSLQDQPFHVLVALLDRPGEIVWREDLRQQVWPEDTFVEFDHALNTAVKKIRSALGDCANSPEYVETIPKRGYRFLAPVEMVDEPPPNSKNPSVEVASRRGLRRNPVAIALVVIVLLSVGLFGVLRKIVVHNSAEKKVVLAVLPLEDWSDGASHALLCDGITQELITQSGHADPVRLVVVPHAATVAYRHTPKTVAEVAHELHADYLMEGNVRGDDEHVRVTVELIRTSDESRVWGEDFDREPSDSLTLESEVAAAITEKAKVALLSAPALR
jgi:TolB-like protein/DNA-binding winged helix-turn-helix (wHTH) protein